MGYLDCHQPTYSPLDILAAAVAMKKQPSRNDTTISGFARQSTDGLQPSFPNTLNMMQPSPESLASDKMVELYFSKSIPIDHRLCLVKLMVSLQHLAT